MSDEIENQEELETEQQEPEQEQEQRQTFSRDDWQKAQADKASAKGWKDFDDYVADGGDPAKWKTADAYNTYGELVDTIKQQKRDFDQRLEGVHKLTQAQLAAQREQLSAKRDEAIESGDKAAVHALDKQISTLNIQPVQSVDPMLDEWNSRNAWIYEKSPKSKWAHEVFREAVQSGKSTGEAIMMVESEVKKHFSSTPSPRTPGRVPESEKGNGSRGFKAASQALTMADLTREESLTYKAMPDAWKSEKEFLQAVADDRKAAKGGAR